MSAHLPVAGSQILYGPHRCLHCDGIRALLQDVQVQRHRLILPQPHKLLGPGGQVYLSTAIT